jgi:hypothetical protein
LVRTVAARVDVDRQTVRTAYVVGIVVSALIYGLVVEAAVLSGTGIPDARALSDATAAEIDGVESDEAVAAGHEIRRMGIENASQIGFVGQWGQSRGKPLRLATGRHAGP